MAITVKQAQEHFTNMVNQGHGELPVYLMDKHSGKLAPLQGGDIAVDSTFKKILVLYPKEITELKLNG